MKEYQHFRKVAEQVHRVWRSGRDVHCGRCGRVIPPDGAFTVVRLDPAGGNARANLAPECQACRIVGADGQWSNPAPPVRYGPGLLPWWASEPAEPPPPPSTTGLADW